jgi:hypothetical protein
MTQAPPSPQSEHRTNPPVTSPCLSVCLGSTGPRNILQIVTRRTRKLSAFQPCQERRGQGPRLHPGLLRALHPAGLPGQRAEGGGWRRESQKPKPSTPGASRKPATRNPNPESRIPKPKPETLKPYTRNLRPQTRNTEHRCRTVRREDAGKTRNTNPRPARLVWSIDGKVRVRQRPKP